MLYIEKFETAASTRKSTKELGINCDLYRAYQNSKTAKNDIINFYEIWGNNIEEIIENCHKNGIIEFSISSDATSLITMLAGFEAHGCRLQGMTTVNHYISDIDGNVRVIPAIKMKIL